MRDRDRPNILFLLNDHQAYYRHGWDGGVAPHRPNFDRLAREGANFERAYAVCPLCTPTRRSMLTGLYPHNHGFVTLEEAENLPTRDQGILYELLARRGYRNYYFGKWHAGPGTAHDFGCQGFSYPGFGNPYTTGEYKAYCQALSVEPASFDVEHVFWEPASPNRVQAGPGYRCLSPGLHTHVTGVIETPPQTHESIFLANLAIDKLRELAAGGGQPWAVHVHFYGPHAPYFASQEYLDHYDPGQIQEYGSFCDDLSGKPPVYLKEENEPLGRGGRLIHPSTLPWRDWQRVLAYVYAQISQVDAAGGLILDELNRLGLARTTLVIWTTDHGDPIAAHGGHFGKEAFLSEEVLRIPLAMRWPGRVASGQVSKHLVSNVDVPVTLLDAAGTSFDGPVDGCSLLDLVMEDRMRQDNPWREAVVCETYGHHHEAVMGQAVVTERFKYAVYRFQEIPDYLMGLDLPERPVELYDLEQDPYQLRNLADSIIYKEAAGDLHRHLRAWCARTGATAL